MNNMIPLRPFATDECGPVSLFEAEVSLSTNGLLWLHYIVDARPEDVVMPNCQESARTDGLWQSTCFEVFVRSIDSAGYLEFNFAPSGLWAAYHFMGYREAMSDLTLAKPPEIYLTGGETWFTIEASVQLPADWVSKDLLANITAVIESSAGDKSYWAAKHAEKQADFHDPDCFVLSLQAGEAP